MQLRKFIDQLSKIESKRTALENLINAYVKIDFCGHYFHLGITYEGNDLNTEDYNVDLDTVEDVLHTIDSFILGAMLTKHIAI